jgi:hypothetical protein
MGVRFGCGAGCGRGCGAVRLRAAGWHKKKEFFARINEMEGGGVAVAVFLTACPRHASIYGRVTLYMCHFA